MDSSTPQTTLSVLIVNWNTRDLLRACLLSIRGSDFAEKLQVVVVDNASSDGSADMVASEFPEVLLSRSERNLGYAAGNNAAFAVANGVFLLTLNPDTELEPDALIRAVARMRQSPEIGVLGARLIGTDGKTQASVRGFPSYAGIFGDLTGLGRRLPGSIWDSYRLSAFDYEAFGPAPQPMGTFLLFRSEALEAIGCSANPFDEDFPIFFNEVDLLDRLAAAGFPAYYDPEIRVKHLGGASTRQVHRAMIWESHRSLIRYFKKRRLRWWNAPLFAAFAAIVFLGAFIRAKGFHGGFRP